MDVSSDQPQTQTRSWSRRARSGAPIDKRAGIERCLAIAARSLPVDDAIQIDRRAPTGSWVFTSRKNTSVRPSGEMAPEWRSQRSAREALPRTDRPRLSESRASDW